MSLRSAGAFDATVQPLWSLYSQAASRGRLPGADEIDRERRKVDWRSIEVSGARVRLHGDGTAITLNGIAQGYATDRVKAVLAGHGVEQALMKMEHDSVAALLKKDVAGFGKYFGEDAVLTTPDGSTQTKAQLIADVKSGDLAIESSTLSEMKVRVYGDAAVVSYVTTDKGKYKKQDISGRYRWTDVFVRRAGEWKIVSSHGTSIAPPPK